MNKKDEKYGVGKIFPTNNYGSVEIVEKIGYNKRKIKFLDYNEYKIINLTNIYEGNISPPSKEDIYAIGKIFKNYTGDEYEIIDKLKGSKRKIKFIGYEHTKIVDCTDIKKGKIKNCFKPTIYGIGYLGKEIKKGNPCDIKIYQTWKDMLRRCYDSNSLCINPIYKNVSVCEEWHNFSNFEKWYLENYPNNLYDIKLTLDKDLLQLGLERKIYSFNTVVFLPVKINAFLTNNQLKNNISGNTGVIWKNKNKKWVVQISDFETGKYKHLGLFGNINDASECYKQARVINVEKVKKYLRNLDYLPEEIIELVR